MHWSQKSKLSTNTDAVKAAIEQEGFDTKYRTDHERHCNRADRYKAAVKAGYSKLVEDYCTSATKKRLEQHPEYDAKIKDKPCYTREIIKVLMQSEPNESPVSLGATHYQCKKYNAVQGCRG